jgi:glycogen debranching enzyme
MPGRLGDAVKAQDEYYILAPFARADDRTRVLKHGETFAVFDQHGDVEPIGLGEQGIYHQGTRFLSRLELRLGEIRPLLLGSTVKAGNDFVQVDLTNPDLAVEGGVITRGTLHLLRTKLLWKAACYERVRLANFGLAPIAIVLLLRFGTDFADIFEVRGTRRERRGKRLPASVETATATFAYRGLDGVKRLTRIELSPAPRELTESHARFQLRLAPQEDAIVEIAVICNPEHGRPRRVSFEGAAALAGEGRERSPLGPLTVSTSNEQFNEWITRSSADLHMMTTETAFGHYPYAGIPWFSAPFGRDGLITALALLWADPQLARGVLSYLAATQATEFLPSQDAEPGKILHEARLGEMAALGEVPFGRYYGSVDATPLFVILAGAYYERTGDRELVESLWPRFEAALEWTTRYGDVDGDGFVEYARHTPRGLVQQGWKDSFDSVFHADGRLAEGPIALCEVQAYVYAARRAAAKVAAALGRGNLADRFAHDAEELRAMFEARFWSDELGTYALALDGDKRACLVQASNAGHCLFAGIASEERARRTADTLFASTMFSGWGIRTLSVRERRYNPMAYHNGSVWPHDNALIALGLAGYGLKRQALFLLTGMFDASLCFDLRRLPELFCGFERRAGEGPILYPMACAPQAWASASVFMLLQACLGLTVDGLRRRIVFRRPVLPESLDRLSLSGLTVGGTSVDLGLERHTHNVVVDVLRRDGDVEILVLH